MVSWLNKAKDFLLGTEYQDEEVMDVYDEEEVERPREKEVIETGYIKSPRVVSQNSKVINFQANIQMQVVISHPETVADATTVSDYLRENKTCVVNLEGVDRANAQRIADFLGGASYSLAGEIQRISSDIFIIAPANVHISGELKEELKNNALIFPWVASSFK